MCVPEDSQLELALPQAVKQGGAWTEPGCQDTGTQIWPCYSPGAPHVPWESISPQ